MIASGEEVTKIESCIISIVKEEQPLLVLARKPEECVICSITNPFSLGNSLKI